MSENVKNCLLYLLAIKIANFLFTSICNYDSLTFLINYWVITAIINMKFHSILKKISMSVVIFTRSTRQI
jgi:hypothetical protein